MKRDAFRWPGGTVSTIGEKLIRLILLMIILGVVNFHASEIVEELGRQHCERELRHSIFCLLGLS